MLIGKSQEPRVSAKDFQRQPGRYQRLAQARPVTITAHGEPSLVIMSVREYERLKRRDREVLVIDELNLDQVDDLLDALRNSPPEPEAAAFDHEMDDFKP
jgi:prevent-host-death family protein